MQHSIPMWTSVIHWCWQLPENGGPPGMGENKIYCKWNMQFYMQMLIGRAGLWALHYYRELGFPEGPDEVITDGSLQSVSLLVRQGDREWSKAVPKAIVCLLMQWVTRWGCWKLFKATRGTSGWDKPVPKTAELRWSPETSLGPQNLAYSLLSFSVKWGKHYPFFH